MITTLVALVVVILGVLLIVGQGALLVRAIGELVLAVTQLAAAQQRTAESTIQSAAVVRAQTEMHRQLVEAVRARPSARAH